MYRDLEHVDQPRYHYDHRLDRIGYAVMDGFCYDIVHGHHTAFAYLKHSPCTAEATLRKALRLSVSCGQFSYTNIKPACSLRWIPAPLVRRSVTYLVTCPRRKLNCGTGCGCREDFCAYARDQADGKQYSG